MVKFTENGENYFRKLFFLEYLQFHVKLKHITSKTCKNHDIQFFNKPPFIPEAHQTELQPTLPSFIFSDYIYNWSCFFPHIYSEYIYNWSWFFPLIRFSKLYFSR